MKTTSKSRTALVTLLFALALPLVPKVNASGPFATNYTNASLTAVYGYSSAGEHLGPSNPSNNTRHIPTWEGQACGAGVSSECRQASGPRGPPFASLGLSPNWRPKLDSLSEPPVEFVVSKSSAFCA